MIAYSRPFWPLFLHVLGAMTLVGGVFAVTIAAWAAWRRPDSAVLQRAAFWGLLAVAVPAYVVMRLAASWIESDEGLNHGHQPNWLKIGMGVADGGLLLILVALGAAYWWRRSANPVAARIVAGLSTILLVALAVAWLAMSGKWS